MKSSTGEHYVGLDHIRALAAFCVFTWHFIHSASGYPVAFEGSPLWFSGLSILDEGHTGVALFMTLSGYLFAKLLNGKTISYKMFLWNRMLRLLPLLVFVIVLVGVQRWLNGTDLWHYAQSVALGIVKPTLPNGGWSITVELHFYLILPLLLWMVRRSRFLLLSLLVFSVLLRLFLYFQLKQIQILAYWTLVGRIDQFVLGIFVYHVRNSFITSHWFAAAAAVVFSIFYWWFNENGGYYKSPSYPSASILWVFMPLIEGGAYSTCICWYDNKLKLKNGVVSKFVAKLGEYSYSIYLLHVFVVFKAAKFVDTYVMSLASFYVACVWSLFFFVLMIIPGYFSFRFVEAPFLKLRRNYVLERRIAS